MRDIRDESCGNVRLTLAPTYMWCPPRTIIEMDDPELARRLEMRLRGEYVELFPKEPRP